MPDVVGQREYPASAFTDSITDPRDIEAFLRDLSRDQNSSGGSERGEGGTPSDPGKDGKKGDCTEATSNPVNIASGHKLKTEADFSTRHLQSVSLVRQYNYASDRQGLFGTRWASNFDRSLAFTLLQGTYCVPRPGADAAACIGPNIVSKITLARGDGSQTTYDFNSASGRYENPSPDAGDWVVRLGNGKWQITARDGSVETYTSGGMIESVVSPIGLGWTTTYSANYLQTVTYSSGLGVQFSWQNGRVSSVVDPAGRTYTYSYNNGYLSSVTYPTTPTVTRTYYYENASVPGALTGIAVDGRRYSTYSYYADGRTYTSGLMDGSVEKITFAYGTNPDGTTYTQVTNAAGAVAKYTYQDYGGQDKLIRVDQSGVTNCPDSTATTYYDAKGHPEYTLDQRGIKTTYSYDYTSSTSGLAKEVITGIDPVNNPNQQRVTGYVWDYSKNRLTDIYRYGASTSEPISRTAYVYYPDSSAAKSRPQSIAVTNLGSNGVYGQTQTTTYTYQFHANGIPSQIVISSPGTQVTRNYDSYGNLTSVIDGLNFTTTFTGYNGLGLPATVADPNGFAVNYTYDARGQIKTVSRTVDGVSATTTFTYDGLGNVYRVDYPDGWVGYNFDSAGRFTGRTGETRNITEPEYTSNTTTSETYTYNNLSKVTNITGKSYNRTCNWIDTFWQCTNTTTTLYSYGWIYDSLARLINDTNYGQNIVYSYDPNGNVKTRTDYLGRAWTYEYDAHDRVKSIKDPLSQFTYYGYDGAGNLATVTDPKNNVTSYSYDGLGNLTRQTSPDTGATTFDYDNLGRLWRLIRNDGGVTTYTGFDALNRVQTVQAGAQSVTYGYDTCSNGRTRLCSVTDSSGSTGYAYRLTGQVASQTSVINGTGFTTNWAYDNRERVSRVTYPGGNYVSYAYTVRSAPTSVTANIGGTNFNVANVTGYIGYNLGPRQTMTFGNGATEGRGYDIHLRLKSLAAGSVQSLSYSYDTNNNLTTITNNLATANNQTYGYDALMRLSSVTSTGLGNQSWTFDANGNREAHTWGGITDDYVPESYSNRIPTVTGSRAKAFGFDSYLGNTTSKTGYGGNQTYAYDPFNRLSSVLTTAGTTSYSYNALNQRVRKVGPGGDFNYVYSPDGTLLGETSNGGTTLTTQYVWLQGQPIGLIRNNSLYYVHADHLARPEVVTNSSRTVVWKANNMAFDRAITTDAIGGLNIGFPGQYYDGESALYYNWNRYYDPSTGRYLQSDPIGLLGGLNTYAYALNRPTMLTDFYGLEACDPSSGQPAIAEWIKDHGSITLSFNAGNGLLGAGGSLSVNTSGVSGYIGAGWGIGFGVSLTADANFGNASGFGITGGVSGGGGVGGAASGTVSLDGGKGVSFGGGLGVGAGGSITAGYSGEIYSFGSQCGCGN